MKKAYLVTYTVMTRVVADVSEDFDPNDINLMLDSHNRDYNNIVSEAFNHIDSDTKGYLVDPEIEEDTECPYGTLEDIEA